MLPSVRPKSKENSKGGSRPHLHRMRGPTCCSLKIAPCSLACSNAQVCRSKPFIWNGSAFANSQKNWLLVGVPNPKPWPLWVTPGAFGDVWRVLFFVFLNKAAVKKRGNIRHALVRDNNFPRFFKALLTCTASRTAALKTKLKYIILVAIMLLAMAIDNEHVHFSHTSHTRGTS